MSDAPPLSWADVEALLETQLRLRKRHYDVVTTMTLDELRALPPLFHLIYDHLHILAHVWTSIEDTLQRLPQREQAMRGYKDLVRGQILLSQYGQESPSLQLCMCSV
jgi:hypothetical protein